MMSFDEYDSVGIGTSEVEAFVVEIEKDCTNTSCFLLYSSELETPVF